MANGNSSGIALIAVLWATALLAALAASQLSSIRTELLLARNAAESAKAEALADAGIARAILALLESDPTKAWRVDGTLYSFALGEGEVRVVIENEAGKIDLNYTMNELLLGLFRSLGLEAEQAAALYAARPP